MKSTEFQIKRNQIVDKLEAFRLEYMEFLREVSPQHWYGAGSYSANLKEMHTRIQIFQQISEEEKNIPWVKEELEKDFLVDS